MTRKDLDNGTLTIGVVLGLLIGAMVALFNAPKRGRDTRTQITEAVNAMTVDPIEESLEEGRAAARRRRAAVQRRDEP